MYFWDKHKTITGYYELLSAEVCDRYGLTQMEYDIRMFLHNNPQHNTAAEIVKVRKSTKSHVSTSLKNLENEGLIERIQSEDNKKHIEIVLLDKAELIAGIVWMIAGVNVARLGVISYLNAESDLGRLAYSRRDLLLFSIWGLAQRWHQRSYFYQKLSVIRNTVFAVTGTGIIILYLISGNTYGYHMTRMAAAIIISFGCYLPVTLFSKTKPKVGLLMIPKTCAYMWIIVMGLQILSEY